MYKVMIIDDEPIIVEGLQKGIPWEKWQCEVVAVGYTGEEGAELVKEIQPDILISDIQMPNMDGLTMIETFKNLAPNVMITILTGYSEFEYAQKAIQLGVFRFLLKPSKMAELEEAIDSMVKGLELRKVQNTMIEDTEIENKSNQLTKVKDDGGAGSFIVQNAILYIEENYEYKLKLSDVADNVYVSQWHLSKLLNRYTGQSFSDILNQTRIEHAKKLLEDPSLRIGDISEKVGFLDMAHFSRVFKKIVGVSANEYRNSLDIFN